MRNKVPLTFCLSLIVISFSYAETKIPFPVRKGNITCNFGSRIHPIIGKVKFHNGVDISGKFNQDVFSIGSGIVIYAGRYLGYGNLVVIRHAKGISTHYAHLKSITKKVGDAVKALSKIGTIGSTGKSTGPHLHFEIRKDGEPTNPKIIY